MSSIIVMLSGEVMEKDVVMKYVQEFGGRIQELGEVSQGMIQEGKAIVWVHYRSTENLNLDEEELLYLDTEHNFKPMTGIALDISSNAGSNPLAIKFCKFVMSKQPNCIVVDDDISVIDVGE